MRADRTWMYKRLGPNGKGLSHEFIAGLEEFIQFALSKKDFVSTGPSIRCPCSKCDNLKFLDIEVVKSHLRRSGFVPDYYKWVSHGEPWKDSTVQEHDVEVISEGNSEETMSNRSLHTGVSIPSDELAKIIEKATTTRTGKEPMLSEVCLTTNKRKNDKIVDDRSTTRYKKYKKDTRMQLGGTLTSEEMVGEGTTEKDAELKEGEDIATKIEGKKVGDNDTKFVQAETSLSKEKVADAWNQTVGEVKEGGTVYGVGSHATLICGSVNINTCAQSHTPNPTPTVNNFVGSPAFEERIDRAVQQRMEDMKNLVQRELRAALLALHRGFTDPQPSPSDSPTHR